VPRGGLGGGGRLRRGFGAGGPRLRHLRHLGRGWGLRPVLGRRSRLVGRRRARLGLRLGVGGAVAAGGQVLQLGAELGRGQALVEQAGGGGEDLFGGEPDSAGAAADGRPR
jgi:hypothetical protein